ncbi:hypothetical protein [Gottfriedia acidiceleris]|uniref:hypothetical protein n=1 Tax=Gottfriedia acidiceleris TaxID=371036 RepID=UPI003D215C7F
MYFKFPKVVYAIDIPVPNTPKPKTTDKGATLESIIKQLGLNKKRPKFYLKNFRVSPVQNDPKPKTTGATLESILAFLELDNLE